MSSEEELTLSNLKPGQKRKARKRVGRGLGSGKGRYSGRGIKGQKARAGSHRMRPGFEGGQMPVYMRLGKQRGPTSKDAMPIGPHRTYTVGVNVSELERVFDAGADVTLEALVEKRLIRNTKTDVKVLGNGELKKKLSVTVHAFSSTAREKIEAAGGTATSLRDSDSVGAGPVRSRKRRKKRAKEASAKAAAATTTAAERKRGEPDPELGEVTGSELAPEGEG
jgi:large subunit ribosomal protein L15